MNERSTTSTHQTTTKHRVRIAIFFGLFLCFLGIVELRLYSLQCVSYEKYQKQATEQHTRKEVIEPKRGWIYDRNGNPLATSVDFFALIASPKDIALQKISAEKVKKSVKKNLDVILANELSPILSMSKRTLLDTLTQDTNKSWLVLNKEISVEQSEQIVQIQKKYNLHNELTLEPVSKRIYPNGDLACHVLGPVGLGYPDTVSAGTGWGADSALGGLEKVKQAQVGGSYGFASSVQDRNGRPLTPMDDNVFLSTEGDQLYLTLDETIQHAAESELAQTIDKYKAKNGFVIVMDPNSGEILALASYPPYDPDNFQHVSKGEWKNVAVNRAVESAVEPGSTFKVFTAAAALEENVVKLTDTFDGHNGKIMFAGKILKDSHPHGILTFPQIIEESSNIGIYEVAQRLKPSIMYDYVKKFGFGKKTGIELPGETPGLVSPLNSWTPLLMSRVSFGQSIAVSAIQMASAISVIANGGLLMKPHIVKTIYNSQNKLVKEYKPEEVRRVISYTTASTMAEIMEGVVLRGTGKDAAIPNYRVGGKTGTAQVPIEGGRGYKKGVYLSSFIGFLPVESPRLVVGVFISEPSVGGYYGATVAAPAFRNIAEAALSQLKIYPKMPEPMPVAQAPTSAGQNGSNKIEIHPVNVSPVSYSDPKPQEVQVDMNSMPDLKGLSKRAAMVLLSQRELNITWKGSGVVIEQNPKAGSKISPSDKCQIVLGSTENTVSLPINSKPAN